MSSPQSREEREALMQADVELLCQLAEQLDRSAEMQQRLVRVSNLLNYLPDLIRLVEQAPGLLETPGVAIFSKDYKRAYRRVVKNALAKGYVIRKKRGKPKGQLPRRKHVKKSTRLQVTPHLNSLP